MKALVLVMFLLLPAVTKGDEYCNSLNINSFKKESRLYPEGAVYVVRRGGRTHFYSGPDGSCKKSQFIIRGDKVQVYTQYNEFVSVVYFKRDGGVETGWVLKESLLRTNESSVHHE